MGAARHETTGRRSALALVIGACVGAALVVLGMMVPDLLTRIDHGGSDGASLMDIGLGTMVFVGAAIVFAVGLLIVGVPAWIFAHRRGFRGPVTALLLGAGLTFTVGFLLLAAPALFPAGPGSSYSAGDSGGETVVNNHMTRHGWKETIMAVTLLSLVGGVVGLTIWRVAYRRVESGDAAA